MALIPLTLTVSIIKMSDEPDVWGNPIELSRQDYLCRIEEQSERVISQSGEEVVASTQILIEGMVDIDYSDYVEYTDELGRTTKKRPIRIETVRGFNPKKVYFTAVYI
jgi:hypothetical protein